MNDSGAMCHRKSFGDLRTVAERFGKGELAAFQSGGKGFAVDEFHHQVVGADIVERADVGMADGRDGAGLLLEAVEEGLIADLDGDAASEPGVGCAKDLAHTAFAEKGFNLVGADTGAGGDGRIGEVADEVGGVLIKESIAARGVVREELLDFAADLGIGTVEHGCSAFIGGVVQRLDQTPALGSQRRRTSLESGGWYYDADCRGLYTGGPGGGVTQSGSGSNSGRDETSETTQLLRAWADGDQGALERLTPRVYRTLRRIAGHQLKNERAGDSMQATALVHEAYLELIDVTNVDWQHRAHFYAVSAQIMRHILLDRARKRLAAKRGGSAEQVNLDEVPDLSGSRAGELVALDDALTTLAKLDERKARVVELRFFGGLSVEETAEVVGVSPETVMRDWKFARSWLHAELSEN